MKKRPDCDYDKRNTCVVICETEFVGHKISLHVDTEEHTHILYLYNYHGNKDIICTPNIDCWSTARDQSAHGEV